MVVKATHSLTLSTLMTIHHNQTWCVMDQSHLNKKLNHRHLIHTKYKDSVNSIPAKAFTINNKILKPTTITLMLC